MGSEFYWKKRLREVGGVLSWRTRAREWIPVDSGPLANCTRCGHKGAACDPDAWAARLWRARTRRAYVQKLATIAEFQETSGEASMPRVRAEFVAARAEAGERQSTLRGYNAAVRAAEALSWICRPSSSCTSALPSLHLRWAYSPICLLRVCASSWRKRSSSLVCCLWLAWRFFVVSFGFGVGEVSGLRMGDVSLPLWLRFWNSKSAEEGWQSRPISPWADRYREALLRWSEAKGLRASDRLFPGGSACLEHKFLEVLGSMPWKHCRWHSLRRGGSTACYARHPRSRFSCGGGDGAASAPPCDMRRHSKMLQSSGLFDCLRRPGLEGQLGYLLTWRFGLPICTLRSLSLYRPPRSTPRPGLRTCWTPPPLAPKALGGVHPQGHESPALPYDPRLLPQVTQPPRDTRERGGPSLLSTPVTFPGPKKGGGGATGLAPVGRDPPSPSMPTSGPQHPDLSSRGTVGMEGIRGRCRLHAPCSKGDMGPLEWWAVRASTDA